MKQAKKYLGLNQAIPYKVLDEVLYYFFKENPLEEDRIKELLKEYVRGENRLGKALSHIKLILTKNSEVLSKLKTNLSNENYIILSDEDRLCLSVSLVSLTFPVTYDLLIIMATGFKVQNKINRNYMNQKMASIYGSNRGIINAIDALVLMVVDYDLVRRDKSGIYEISQKKKILNKAINELFIYTDIKLSGSKSILLDDLEYRPWYMYFKHNYSAKNSLSLIKLIESRVGQGYLTI